jgi:hypothetical protein
MAVLSSAEQVAAWQEFSSAASSRQELIGTTMTKHEVLATAEAIDQWIDDNIAAFNSAIPEPGRSQLTAKQKAEIFMYIVRRRWEVS